MIFYTTICLIESTFICSLSVRYKYLDSFVSSSILYHKYDIINNNSVMYIKMHCVFTPILL
ncbi:unknown [Taterapox virus]|uniref:Uncharacterized protein n=1 Tax=Taterapox virus TaxID=28871 RepID=Q0NP00_9POXV|nr:hypothetical protein TATV_DAH68_211 [Taterapox virus]ABD97777.1 unknown [Taterapox virus]